MDSGTVPPARRDQSLCAQLQRTLILTRSQPKRAVELLRKIVPQTESADAGSLQADAHRLLGEALGEAGEFAASTEELLRALALFTSQEDRRGIATIHLDLGVNAFSTGDRTRAAQLEQQAYAEFSALGDDRGRLHVMVRQAFFSENLHDKDQGLQKAEALARSLRDEASLAEILHQSGDSYFTLGDDRTAYEKYVEAATLFEKNNDQLGLALVDVSLGRLERSQGDPAAALRYYHRALRLQQKAGDAAGAVQTLNAIAVAYDSAGRRQEGIRYYKQALAQARAIHSPRHILFELGNLGDDYVAAGQIHEGIALLERVVRQEKSPYLLAYRYDYLAQGYGKIRQYDRALVVINKAFAIWKQQKNQEALLGGLEDRAQILDELGRDREALADTQQALAVLEAIRSHLVPNDYRKQGFAQKNQDLYDLAIKIHFKTGNYREALQVAEEGRARAFLDLMATRENAPAGPTGPSAISTADAAVVPVAEDSDASTAPFTAAQMAETARRMHSTILAYWSAPDALYIWVIDGKGSVHAKRQHVRKDALRKMVEAARSQQAMLRPATAPLGGQGIAKLDPWRRLYNLVIGPISRYLPRKQDSLLTVIPHGPLLRLPFSALRDAQSKYLIERYAIHYVPAAAVLPFTELNAEKSRLHPLRYLFVADGLPSVEDGRVLPALAASRPEVMALYGMVGGKSATLLTDTTARVPAVISNMRNATYIHIAAHAIIDDNDPLGSYLALAPGTGDGRLTAAAISRLHIPADLVVLSACQSALGKVTGDGIVGMTRAFFSAGAASVLAGVWDVADVPTARLMRTFYRSMLNGESKADALRTAQLQLIRELRNRDLRVKTAAGNFVLPESPTFWAGFVLVGLPN